jgi:hypothetical protein
MLPDSLKQILALVVAVTLSALTVAWGYVAIDSIFPMSVLERLTPLLMASMFSCALVMTAVRFMRSRNDLFD